MKIGIITLWSSRHNYGQKLQIYALLSFLKKEGHTPILIKYIRNSLWWNIYLPYEKSYIYFLKFINIFKENKNWTVRNLDGFLQKNILSSKMLKNKKQLIKFCKSFPLMITGSDQVWASFVYKARNGKPFISALDALTLNLPIKGKKVSYAASLGKHFPDENDKSILLNRIKCLNLVSVRESNLKAYLNENGINCQLVPDPVFLLSKKDYIQLAGNKFYEKKFKKQILHYAIKTESYLNCENVSKYLSGILGNDFVDINGLNKERPVPQTKYATIEEWISYIGNAQLVITNSFHAVAFCIIFQTDFYFYPLREKGQYIDGRVENLLSIFEIKDRILLSNQNLYDAINNPTKINWKGIDSKLSDYKHTGVEFLSKAISLVNENT